MANASAAEPVEIAELVDFLTKTAPFDVLEREAAALAARNVEITYARSGSVVLELDEDPDALALVRSGAVELRDENESLVARLGEREYFAYPALLTDQSARRRVTTIEDTLLYLIPEAVFARLRNEYDAFDRFFVRAYADRVRDALSEKRDDVPLRVPVRSLLHRAPVCASPDVSIREAAQTMRDARVSSLLIRDDDGLVGVLTDRDLRNRVIADDADVNAPVRSVMTPDPVSIAPSTYAFEALLTMSRANVHHLPVTEEDGTIAGMITTTDLMRLQADNPVYLVGEVWKQDDLDGLVDVSTRIPEMVATLVGSGARAEDVGRTVSAVTDAITERLLKLAEDELGAPPVPYAWLALGSQARGEQTAHSDQDNALLLSDDFDKAAHDDYFLDLATFVCDGLNACGYEYCPGEVMATTDRWRQPLQKWKTTFRNWIEEPRPKSLMHATIFFDLRHVHGKKALTKTLHDFVLDRTSQNTIFLASLTSNALDNKPPLGFFRQFVLDTHGEEVDTLDLKLNGVVPIIDAARIYALAHGISNVSTLERLSALADTPRSLSRGDAEDLRDAFTFISSVRLRHQAAQIRQGETPNNYVSPDALSDFERRHLKDAFKIVKRMQSSLSQRYQTDFIS